MPFTDDLVTRLKMQTANFDKGVKESEKKTSGFGKLWATMGKNFVVTAGDMVRAVKAIARILPLAIDRGGTVGDVMASASLDIDSVSRATQGLVSKFDLAQTANKVFEGGLKLTQTQFETITKAAVIMGQKTGTDSVEAVNQLTNSLVTGATRGFKPFGIQVDALTGNVTEAEKALHVKTEALRQLEEQFGTSTVVVDDAGESLAILRTKWTDTSDAMAVNIANSQDTIMVVDFLTQAIDDLGTSLNATADFIRLVAQGAADFWIRLTEGSDAANRAATANFTYARRLEKTWATQKKAEAAARALAAAQAGREGSVESATKKSTKAAKEHAKALEDAAKTQRQWLMALSQTAALRATASFREEELEDVGFLKFIREEKDRARLAETASIREDVQTRFASNAALRDDAGNTARAIIQALEMQRSARRLDEVGNTRAAETLRQSASSRVAHAQALDAETAAWQASAKAQAQAAITTTLVAGAQGGLTAGVAAFGQFAKMQALVATGAALTSLIPIPGLFNPPAAAAAFAAAAAWGTAAAFAHASTASSRSTASSASAIPETDAGSAGAGRAFERRAPGSAPPGGGGGGGDTFVLNINGTVVGDDIEAGRRLSAIMNRARREDNRPRV